MKKIFLYIFIFVFLCNLAFSKDSVFLVFSDHPEKIKANGKLLEGGLIKNKSIRINYYHLNAKNQPDRWIFLSIYNPNKSKAKILISYVYAGPDKSAMKVGHKLATNYLLYLRDKNYNLVEIKPKSRKTILMHYMPSNNIVSGIIDLVLISQNSVYYTLYTNEVDKIPFHFLKDAKDVHAKGFYDLPDLYYNINYNLKSRYSFLLGDFALSNLFKGKVLKGSYGSVINVKIKLYNPFKKGKFVYFFFQPRGGVAQGVFSVNNQLIFAPLTKAFENRFLFKIFLKSKQKKLLHIKTLCEGGSNYPVKIIMEAYDK